MAPLNTEICRDELERLRREVAELRDVETRLRREIEERKRLEDSLRASETRFRTLVEQSPFSIIIYDKDGRILMANPASQQLWQIPPEHFSQLKTIYNILEDDVLAKSGILKEIKRAFAGETVTIPATMMALQEYPCQEMPTPQMWVSAYAYPVKDELGQIQEVVVMHEDVTERVLANEALRHSQKQFEAFFTQSLDGCFFMMLDEPVRWDNDVDKEAVLDHVFAHQRITKINQAMLDQYGADKEAFIEMTPADLMTHDIEHGRQLWRDLFDNGRIRLESDERKLDGTPMWVEGEYVCFYDEDGRISGHFGIQREITVRKQMEFALWESEGHFRSLMESAQDFVLYRLQVDPTANLQATVVFVSYSITEIMGISDPYNFSSWFEHIHPDDLPRVLDAQRRSTEEGFPFHEDMRIYHSPKKEWRWIRAISYPVFNNAEELVYYNGLMLDLTGQKRAEEALRQSETRYRTLIQTLPYGVQEVDLNGRIAYVNPAFCQTAGYSNHELIGRYVWDMVATEADRNDLRENVQYIHQMLPEPKSYFTPSRTKDGRLIDVQADWDYRRNSDGDIIGTIAIITDITARKKAEKQLHRYNRRLQILHEVAQAILLAQSPKAIANAVLSRIRESLPFSSSSLVLFDFTVNEGFILASYDQQHTEIIAGASRPLNDFDIDTRLFNGEVVVRSNLHANLTGLVERLKAEGVQAYLSAPLIVQGQLIGALYMAAKEIETSSADYIEIVGEIAKFLAVAIQQARLHERVQHHAVEMETRVAERTRDLTEANNRLLELDRLKTKFISDVTHELRTPVTNLGMYLDLMAFGKPEKFEGYQKVLREQTERLKILVEDTLDLSRLDVRRDEIELSSLPLAPIVEQAAAAHHGLAQKKGLAFELVLDADLPNVLADSDQLGRAISNLLQNAIRYTTSGQVEVRTFGDETAVSAALQIKDTGMGMDKDDLAHCFEPFYRGVRVGQLNMPGNGLGLTLVKEIVELHHGRIEIESEINTGTTVTVWLPVDL